METKVIENGTQATILIRGALNVGTADEADQIFAEVAKNHDEVVLDLTELKYLSSAGIRSLRNLYMSLYRKGGHMKIENANDMVTSVLEMAGLMDFMMMNED